MEDEDSLITDFMALSKIGTFEKVDNIEGILERAVELQNLANELGRTLAFSRAHILEVWNELTDISFKKEGLDGARGVLPVALKRMILPDKKITPQYGLRDAFLRALERWKEVNCNN